jgi:hypothetical protein
MRGSANKEWSNVVKHRKYILVTQNKSEYGTRQHQPINSLIFQTILNATFILACMLLEFDLK